MLQLYQQPLLPQQQHQVGWLLPLQHLLSLQLGMGVSAHLDRLGNSHMAVRGLICSSKVHRQHHKQLQARQPCLQGQLVCRVQVLLLLPWGREYQQGV